MEDAAARRAAQSLLAAHKANARFKSIGPPDKPAGIADAYDIQDKYVALLRGEHGNTEGYKVGLTSATMQTFCGIDHPIAGVVLASRVHRSARPSGARITGGSASNSKSRFVSRRMFRSRPRRVPPK